MTRLECPYANTVGVCLLSGKLCDDANKLACPVRGAWKERQLKELLARVEARNRKILQEG